MSVSMERKAELFDYLAKNLKEMKVGDDWLYMDGNQTAEKLERLLDNHMQYDDEEDDDLAD